MPFKAVEMVTEHKTTKTKGNFHEAFAAGEVAPPPPRSTGLVFAVIALIVAVIFRENMTVLIAAISVATILAGTSYIAPHLLQPLNIVWFKFGMLLHRIVNPLVMFLMFAIAFLPMGLAMQLFKDPLRLKRSDNAKSYWLDPDPDELKLSSMKNQF